MRRKIVFTVFTLLAALSIIGCGGGSNKITVNIKNGDADSIFLRYYSPYLHKYVNTDSAAFASKSVFNVDSLKEGVYTVWQGDKSLATIFVGEKRPVDITVDYDYFVGYASIKGSEQNDYLKEYEAKREKILLKSKELENKMMRENGGSVSMLQMTANSGEYQKINKQLYDLAVDFKAEHPTDLVGIYAMMFAPVVPKEGAKNDNLSLMLSYWDNFPFNNPKSTLLPHYKEVLGNFTGAALQMDDSIACLAVKNLLSKAEVNNNLFRTACDGFAYWYGDKSQPLRHQQTYIEVLSSIVNSANFTDMEKMPYIEMLKDAKSNLKGSDALPLDLVDMNGKRVNPIASKAKWTVLLFYDPDCPNCKQLAKDIEASNVVKIRKASGDLEIFAIYAGTNEAAWKNCVKTQEGFGSFTNVWDDKQQIDKGNIYDTGVSPMMYVIDPAKKVRVKDANLADIEVYSVQ